MPAVIFSKRPSRSLGGSTPGSSGTFREVPRDGDLVPAVATLDLRGLLPGFSDPRVPTRMSWLKLSDETEYADSQFPHAARKSQNFDDAFG